MAVELDDLARHRDVIPLLAAWHVREWEHLYPEWTVEAAIAELEATTSGAVPHTIVAFDAGGRSTADVAGSVSIIDDDELHGFEHVRPWLASVYVRPSSRRVGVGTQLVTAAVEFASRAGIDRLHLLTADESEFYERLGWRRVGDADKNGRCVTVMRIDTDGRAPRRAFAADWCTNPWFRCAYSYLRADGTPADRDVLAAANAPGLMFAGEAASRDHPGTAHGAWFSGERAAREVCATAPATVLVVGAGLAGIAAARIARECGAAVTVLEATSRIGGRATSSRRLGGPVNVGAAWMHGTAGHPLFDVFSRRGGRIDADTFRDTTTFVAGRGELAGGELASLEHMSGEIAKRIAAATGSAATGSTVADVLGPAIDDIAVDEVSATVLRSWFRGEYENLYAAPPADLSLRHAEEPFRLPGPDLMITVATDELVAELAEGVAITFDAPVRAVTRRDGRWCVATDDGELHADAVIVTVSLGVLKSDAIVFDPPLAAATRDAMGRIGAGLVTKAFFAFDTAFWAPRRAFWVVDDPAPEFELWVDVSSVRGAPTLCAFAVGDDAVRVEGMSEEDLLDLGRGTLLSATGLTSARS